MCDREMDRTKSQEDVPTVGWEAGGVEVVIHLTTVVEMRVDARLGLFTKLQLRS
jgi:hypothetical protein